MSGAAANIDVDSRGGVVAAETARWGDATVSADTLGEYRWANLAGVHVRPTGHSASAA